MQSTNQPAKFLVPFAQNDSAKVEIPATSSDPTRFSQSLGSPPLTGMPPEAGGVPPQLEDFNGAMNQLARGVWWALGGGRFAYDASWANDPLINGYARGAVLPAALGTGTVGMGEWYNNAEANTADPDATGSGWVPGYHYGTTALTGQTGGTVTLTPAQAAKRVITVAGTLTSNLVLVLPGWIYNWRIVNNTGGAFTVTAKNAATAAVEIPQNGAPTIVNCDGTQVSLDSPNIAPAVLATQPMQLGQATGRLLRTSFYSRNSGGTQTVAVDGGAATATGAGTFTPLAATQRVRVRLVGGGGGGGNTATTAANSNACGGGGGSGTYSENIFPIATVGASVTVTVGAAGTPVAQGGTSQFGSLAAGEGGNPGETGAASSTFPVLRQGGGGGAAGLANVWLGVGQQGLLAHSASLTQFASGAGGSTPFGGGAGGKPGGTGPGNVVASPGAGGGGAVTGPNQAGQLGGNGAPGCVVVEEYS